MNWFPKQRYSKREMYKEKVILASIQYRAANAVLDFANHKMNGIVKKCMSKEMSPQKEPIDFPARYRKRVDIIRDIYQGRPVYTLLPKSKIVADKEIIFLHGGGGVMPPTSLHFDFAVSLVEKTSVPLHFLMYPLAPKANCAEAVIWLESWYEDRIAMEPNKEFYVIGDSAGAGLSVALSSGGRKQLAGTVLISPAAGLDEKEKYMTEYEEHDVLLSMELMDGIADCWGKGMELTDYRLNSAYADFNNFPRCMIIYGGREMFAGTIPVFKEKMSEANINLSLIKGEIHCHDWPLAQLLPESKEALKEIAVFIG